MIVNLFEKALTNQKNNEYVKPIINSSEKLNVSNIQKYIIENFIDYIKQEKYKLLFEEIEKYLYKINPKFSDEYVKNVEKQVVNKMFGYHILQKYIDDPNISDIRAIKYDQIYIKQEGKWKKVDDKFNDEQEFIDYIRYCVLKNNDNISYDSPIVIFSDKKYNLRIEAGLEPVNSISPSIVIRIHRHNLDISLESLFVKDDMLDKVSYTIISQLINSDKSIVICGKGGSGKTTLLRAIIKKLPESKSIILNEETLEIYCENKNIIQRQVVENRIDTKKITLEMLTKHSLVTSNDVIIVGELKGSESAYFMDSIATGHQGFTTIHCNNAISAIDRLIILIKKNISFEQYKDAFIQKLLAESIDNIIFLKDYKVDQIVDVMYDKKINTIKYNFLYQRKY